MTEFHLHPVDIAVLVAYALAVIGIAVWVSRKIDTGEDLFLAGRSLTWGVVGFSLFASNISSTTLIGLSGQAYSAGIAVSNYEWMAGVVLVFMAAFIIPVFLTARISTVPEYLEKRFNRQCRLYFSALTIFISIIVDTSGALYAASLTLKTFFPSLVIWHACIIMALFAGLYTAFGGLKAVVFTDVLQAVVLLLGCCALTYLTFERFDFSWEQATANLPERRLDLLPPMDDPSLPWLGTLVGVPILGFWYWSANQYITQRILAARSIRDAQQGAVLAGLLKLLPLFIMVLPGVLAIKLFPDLTDGDQVFPMLIREVLPIGLTGLVLAGLFAAIMSSIDSTLNSASTLIIKDFVENDENKRVLSKKDRVFWGRMTTIILMVVAAAWAPLIAEFKGLFAYLQQAFSVVVPPVVAVFILGVFWRGATAKAAFMTLIIGHIIGAGFFVASNTQSLGLSENNLWDWHFTLTVGLTTAISFALLFLLSLVTEKSGEEVLQSTVWRKDFAIPADTVPLWQDYRLYGGIMLALTVIMLIVLG